MKKCAEQCFESQTRCENKECRLWLDYEEDLNCTLIAINNHGPMTLREIAKRENAIFIVEVHSSKKVSIMENTDRILHWCKQNNYRSYYLSEHREITNSDLVRKRGRYHMLLIHNNRNYPEGLINIKQGAHLEDISK